MSLTPQMRERVLREAAEAAIRAYMRQPGGPTAPQMAKLLDFMRDEVKTCCSGIAGDTLKDLAGRLNESAWEIISEFEMESAS